MTLTRKGWNSLKPITAPEQMSTPIHWNPMSDDWKRWIDSHQVSDLPPGKPGRFWKRLHKKRYSDFSFQALSIGIARARTVNQAPHWEH